MSADLRALALGVLAAAGVVPAQAVADTVRAFAPFDLDGDGRAEVKRLAAIAEAGEAGKPLVVVLVEGRLARHVDHAQSVPPFGLQEPLRQFAQDLAAEGFRALVLAADVHAGPPHQDGRTVLAIRRLFQRLHAQAPMAGAVLVGHFPDALLVRTCNWRRNEKLSLPGKDGKPIAFEPATTNVRCVPEIVAHRCDLVLADLDGDWERVYVSGPATLRSAWAVFGDTVPDAGGPCVALQEGELAVTDVFHVRDGAAVADGKAFTLHLDPHDRDRECSAADRARGNPLARPEIAVSRIDARGIAWKPPLDACESSDWHFAWVPKPLASQPAWQIDDRSELRELQAYFARNHAFRTRGVAAAQHRPASIAHELGSGMASLRAAAPAWTAFGEEGYDVAHGADLLALRRWLQLPAVLRTLRAHSDPYGAMFAASDPKALHDALGAPWHWVKEGDTFVPSWRDHAKGRADFAFYRAFCQREFTRRADGAGVPDNPFLLIHTGCEALSPPHSDRPYDDPAYGRFAHAESILFFTECLAIVGRAKVFYDEPRGFGEALAAGKTFGEAWQRYFAIESEADDWREVGDDIGRKRSYFWSVVGDWTLRLPQPR